MRHNRFKNWRFLMKMEVKDSLVQHNVTKNLFQIELNLYM